MQRTEHILFCAALLLFILVPNIASADVQIEDKVREFFTDTPVMIAIAQCESKFRQFDSQGAPLRGGWGGGMVGVFQIYESVHAKAADALGLDLSTLEGNMGYAKHLYDTLGTNPWNSAEACWKQAGDTATRTELSGTEIARLKARIKELTKIIAQLQELLEKKKKLS